MISSSNSIELSIIGAGRFGYFWGKHLSKYYPVSFYDIDQEREKEVQKIGQWNSLESCLNKKYIFLTIPIRQLKGFLKKYGGIIHPGSTVIDCASVKVPVMRWFHRYLPEDIYYVASHPLFGPDSAKSKLLGQTMVLLPGKVPYIEYQFLVNLFTKSLGLKVFNLTAAEHDELMAYNLNLVHYLGRALDDLGIPRVSLMMSSLSKLDDIVSVVMNDTTELFLDFYKYNPYAKKIHGQWLKSFEKINDQISKNKWYSG